MSNGARAPEESVAAAYEALNASYRMMDEYMRQAQMVAERVWLPWIGTFSGGASPFVPPEQWIRAYGDVAMAWAEIALRWSRGLGPWIGAPPGPPRHDSPPSASNGAIGTPR